MIGQAVPNAVTDRQAFVDELCRRDFVSFVLGAYPVIRGGALLEHNWHFDAIAHSLELVARGSSPELLVTLPPRHLKSIMISVAWVAWMLGRNPRLTFVCVSYSNELAAKHARDCRALMQSSWYRNLFPHTVIRRSRSAVHDFETTASGGRLATSTTGTLTGRGGEYIIVDDALKPDEANSEAAREGVNEWFFSTLASRLDKPADGAIIVVMQRLHQFDLAGMLLDRGWGQLCLPAIAPEDVSIPLTRNRVFQRDAGEALHPARYNLEQLEARRRKVGSRLFAAQYLQDPVPAKGNIVKAAWLQSYEREPPADAGGQIIQSWDVATKEGEQNDWSVCITARRLRRKIYVLDVWRQRVEFTDLWKAVHDLARKWQAHTLLVEEAANGYALIQRLRYEQPRGMPSPIARRPKLDKVSRLNAASTMIEAGDLLLPKEAPWLASFKSELLGFPSTRNDDQVDALSQLMNWADERWEQPPPLAGPLLIDEYGLATGEGAEGYNACSSYECDDPWGA